MDFSPDGTRLAVDSITGTIAVWDWRSRKLERSVDKTPGGNDLNVANPVRFSFDGRFFANCETSGAGDVTVRIWATDNWSIAKDLTAGPSPKGAGICTDMAFAQDGMRFVRTADTGGQPGNNVIVYSVATWEPIWATPLEGIPRSLAISPNGQLVAVSAETMSFPEGVSDPIKRAQQVTYAARVYLVDLGRRLVVTTIVAGVLGPLAWSPDGTRLVMTGGGGIEVLDVQSGKVIVHEEVGNTSHTNVRFTSDGRYLIESDTNGMGKGLGVHIWDSRRHKLLQHIPGDIGSIAVSRDGRLLAIGEMGRTTIWRLQ
jgi:WD40 repeat protein